TDNADSAPVAIVDESAAARLFGGRNPIGQRVAFEFAGHDVDRTTMVPRWREVVGVVRHVRHYGLTTEPPYVQVYAPFSQMPMWFENRRPAMALVARTEHPDTLVPALRRAVLDLDSRLPVYGVQPMRDYVAQRVEQPRIGATLLGGF